MGSHWAVLDDRRTTLRIIAPRCVDACVVTSAANETLHVVDEKGTGAAARSPASLACSLLPEPAQIAALEPRTVMCRRRRPRHQPRRPAFCQARPDADLTPS